MGDNDVVVDVHPKGYTGPYLWIDQYGQPVWARTVRELREKVGGGAVSKMYVDKLDGRTVHVGYVVGRRWFTKYMPVEAP